MARHFKNRSPPTQRSVVARRRRKPLRWRFRWTIWVGILGVILFFLWLSAGLKPSFSWEGIMDVADIQDIARFTKLVTLGVIGVAICLVLRLLRPKDDDS